MAMATTSPAFWTEYKTVLNKLNVPEKKVNFYVGGRLKKFIRHSGNVSSRFSGSATF